MVYTITKYLLWPVFNALFVKRIDGLENIPKEPALFIANHHSYLDGPMVLLMLAWHKNLKVYSFATNTGFESFIWNWLFRHFGAIRIGGSMEKAFEKMKQGFGLALFPEGRRSDMEKIGPLVHSGAGVVALKTNCRVIPIGIDTFHFWNRYQTIPTFRRNITITIGKPMKFKGKATRAKALDVTKKIMKEVDHLARISHVYSAPKIFH